jgi:hypothetical protein
MIDWKKVLTSKTVWLGVFMILAAIAEYLAGIPAGTTFIQGLSGVLAIVVRFLTNDSLVKK